MTWYQWATAGAALCAAVLALWPAGSAPTLEPVAAVSTPEERPRNWHGDDDQGYVY